MAIYDGGAIKSARNDKGQRYTALPAAFAFRSKPVNGCACNDPTSSQAYFEKSARTDPTLQSGDVIVETDGAFVYSGRRLACRSEPPPCRRSCASGCAQCSAARMARSRPSTTERSIFGMDPAYFLFMFYFGFLWYVLWMLIPFVGTYGCASTGMCGWGAFNQLISRAGLFRLKVKDKALCSSCTTKECSKVCPMGLTDQPSAFAAKGEFRNYKCVGDGNCVSACPSQNISFYDVRHWLRERFSELG